MQSNECEHAVFVIDGDEYMTRTEKRCEACAGDGEVIDSRLPPGTSATYDDLLVCSVCRGTGFVGGC